MLFDLEKIQKARLAKKALIQKREEEAYLKKLRILTNKRYQEIIANKKHEKAEKEALKEKIRLAEEAKSIEIHRRRLAQIEAQRLQKEKEIAKEIALVKKEQEEMLKLKIRLKKEEEEAKRIAKEKQRRANAILAKVDLSQQRMKVYKGKKLLYTWKVSTAKKGYKTPKGSFSPYLIKSMHYSRQYNNSPMPYTVFFKEGYAVHGTKSVKRLGRIASHGCVRLATPNAKKLFLLIRKSGMDNSTININP